MNANFVYRAAIFLINEVKPQRSLKVTFLVTNGMNANITKMPIFDDMKFDLFIILTNVLMDNLYPCFISTFLMWVTLRKSNNSKCYVNFNIM